MMRERRVYQKLPIVYLEPCVCIYCFFSSICVIERAIQRASVWTTEPGILGPHFVNIFNILKIDPRHYASWLSSSRRPYFISLNQIVWKLTNPFAYDHNVPHFYNQNFVRGD